MCGCAEESISAEELVTAEDWGYIRPVTDDESPFCVRPVTGSHLFRSPIGRVLGLWLPHLPFRHLLWTILGGSRFSCLLFWWDMMSARTDLPMLDQAEAATAAAKPLPGTFIGLGLDLRSDKLYDLGRAIPDVMGLRAIQPKVAVVKVMSVPDSRCVRVVIPDDHLLNRFHEILIHDVQYEEPPFVALSDLGCLRLDWPRALFTFMGRHQFELDQLRKECRQRFGCTQSGSCTTCGKHIQQNLGKHDAFYHMELAQLWRCPVTWCTVRKGTPQDCIDHRRKAHDTPPLVKAANLAHWFPPWTVSREQWSSLTWSAVSGIAVDILLFSQIGMPLFHRYRVFDRPGTHAAFRGTYMQRMHTFLEESDDASL